jgi:hypothetical protein
MLQLIVPALVPIVSKIVGNLFPDPEAKAKAEQEVLQQLLEHRQQIESAAASIIKTEAASTHWLASNWRPLTMIVFVALIVARWFGWSAPNLAPEEYLMLWEIVKLGLGGYIIGRSVEKITPNIVDVLKNK